MPNSVDSLEQTALASVSMGAWAWDIDEDRITWSDNVNTMFGLDPAVHSGRLSEVLGLVHPESRGRLRAELEGMRTDGAEWVGTHRLNVPGRERWARARGRLTRAAEGQPRRMVGIIEDVSVIHSLDADHSSPNALMRAALDASLFAVIVLDPNGRIVYANELAAHLLGLSQSAVQDCAYDAPQFKHTNVDGGPWPDENQPFVRVMKTGCAVHGIEHCIERPDGRTITLRISGAPIKNERGEIKLVVTSFEDITERRALDAALRQSQKLEAVGRLAGGVAHDFNNLLTAILSYAALARGELSRPTKLLECLDGITQASERAAQLTRQLLAFARREVNRPTSLDLGAEVTTAASLIERVLSAQVTVQLDLPSDPCWIRMDANNLQQILLNLAINASDAMPEGGKIRLSVRCTDHESVILQVVDTGLGMDEQTRQQAFEPFFTTKPAHQGTGLGLSTCHGIVVQAGGRITLHSELGRGTRVEIELPIAAPPGAQPAAPGGSKHEQKQSGRILIVEDDPTIRRIGARVLESAGFEVFAAGDASQALDILRAERVDLIVCDLVLPGMSGLDLIDRVRRMLPRVRVLFVSGYSSELQRTGREPFLSKPFAPETLRQRVADVLAGST